MVTVGNECLCHMAEIDHFFSRLPLLFSFIILSYVVVYYVVVIPFLLVFFPFKKYFGRILSLVRLSCERGWIPGGSVQVRQLIEQSIKSLTLCLKITIGVTMTISSW